MSSAELPTCMPTARCPPSVVASEGGETASAASPASALAMAVLKSTSLGTNPGVSTFARFPARTL
jgi:hypothetical protein